MKLCKDCHYLSKLKNCNYFTLHKVLEPVNGTQISVPLHPSNSRGNESYCGAKGRWFASLNK
jgi:hypothetical protein